MRSLLALLPAYQNYIYNTTSGYLMSFLPEEKKNCLLKCLEVVVPVDLGVRLHGDLPKGLGNKIRTKLDSLISNSCVYANFVSLLARILTDIEDDLTEGQV